MLTGTGVNGSGIASRAEAATSSEPAITRTVDHARRAAPPEGRNTYAWVLDSDQADLFLTYCTNAVLARREMPSLQIVSIPAGIAVGADYGITVLDGAPDDAENLADFILAPKARSILESYGFEPASGS